MGSRLLEWCADAFGVTTRTRVLSLALASVALLTVGFVLGERWGVLGVLVPMVLMASAIVAARQVMRARDRAWRAACVPVSALVTFTAPDPGLASLTAMALHYLGVAVAAARAGRYAEATAALDAIDRARLRPEEIHLAEAARALISLGLGHPARAAQQAIVALPTGASDIDAHLGRTLVADAWNDAGRLRATLGAWARAGVPADRASPLAKLDRLVRVRIEPSLIDDVAPGDAHDLAEEARFVGDEDLAASLEARARSSAYR